MLESRMAETSGRYDKRNFLLNAAEGGLFIAGGTLISAQTILPALVTRLGGGNVAVGALGVIVWMGLFLPQVFASRYGQTLEWKKPWVVGFGTAQRTIVLLSGITILALGSSHPMIALGLFLGLFTINQLFTGITTPVWFDFYAKLIPLERRGRLTGMRNSLGGALSFLSGFLLTWILGTYEFPLSYALLFFVSFLLQLSSITAQTQMVEEFPSKVMQRQPVIEYLRRLPDVLKENPGFRTFIAAMVFLILSAMPSGFFTVYAIKRFHATESSVGIFTVILMAGIVLGGIFNGYLADKYGNRLALISAASAMFMASAAALFAPSVEWVQLVYLFVGINLGSELMTRYNLAIEYGPVEQRATYIGLMNTLLAPVYLSGFLGGWISNTFGYHHLFLTGLFCSIIGILLLITRVREPRKKP